MKILIAGRTGTGKTRLADAMVQIGGLKLLKTTTTRPPRDEEDAQRYHFVSQEEADKVGAKFLYTKIGDYEYYCSREDLENCDVAILDPIGVQDMTALFPEEIIHLIYIHVNLGDDTAVTKLDMNLENRAKNAEDPDEARKAIIECRASERERFEMLEELLFDTEHPDGNPNLPEQKKIFLDPRYHGRIVSIADFANDFNEETLNGFAANQVVLMRKFKNLKTIVKQCVDLEVLPSPVPGHIPMRAAGSHEETLRPIEDCVYAIQRNHAVLAQIIDSWLTHELNIGVPAELAPEFMGKI